MADILNTIIADRFKVVRKLGSGSFGEIFLVVDMTSKDEYAIKLEPVKTRYPQLNYESRVYRCLTGGTGIPRMHWIGTTEHHLAMVVDLLGPSLEELFNYCNRQFSIKTVVLLADQMLERIEFIHSRNILHRDIKPDNFLMGVGRRGNRVYAIDYGLAKAYRYPKTQEHIPMKEGKSLTGTARYASSNTHCGLEQSRRDDLESIGYVLIYFLKGHLPWQGMQANGKKVKYDLIRDKKLSTSTSVLCRGLPIEFQVYLDYVKKLEFDATPDYRRLRKLFHDVYKKQGYQDYVFDWVVKQQKELDRTGQHVWREQLKPVAKK